MSGPVIAPPDEDRAVGLLSRAATSAEAGGQMLRRGGLAVALAHAETAEQAATAAREEIEDLLRTGAR